MGDEASIRDPSVIWVWAVTKSKLILEWEGFSGIREERRTRELNSSWKVVCSHRGETQSPGSPREQVKIKNRALKRYQEARAPSLTDLVTLSKFLGLTECPAFPQENGHHHTS